MKFKLVVFLLIFSLFTLSACGLNVVNGNGRLKTEEREIADFSRIEFSGFGDINIQIGASSSLTVTADENILPHLYTIVEDDTLRIYSDADFQLNTNASISYTITSQNLSAIALSGFGNVNIAALESPSFSIDMSGAGTINIDDLQTESLSLNLSGAGSVVLTGAGVAQNVELSGAGSYDASHFASQQAEVSLSGAGSATVRVSESLTGDLSGIGTLNYIGNPSVNVEISGLSNIVKLED